MLRSYLRSFFVLLILGFITCGMNTATNFIPSQQNNATYSEAECYADACEVDEHGNVLEIACIADEEEASSQTQCTGLEECGNPCPEIIVD